MDEPCSSLALRARARGGDARCLAPALLLPQPARAWHADLCRRLDAAGLAPALRSGDPTSPILEQRALLRVEARLGRPASALRAVPYPAEGRAVADASRPALVLDGSPPRQGDLVPLFDGAPGEHRLPAAILAGGRPRLAVARVEPDGLAILAEAVPALADPASFARSLDDCYDRLATLLVAALAGAPHHPPAHPPIAIPHRPGLPGAAARYALRGLGGKAWRRMAGREEHWRVCARAADGRSHVLADDGRRYYADPFPLLAGGRLHVFFEDLDLATRRGVISASVFGPDGFSPPRPVLARPYHLSYPQVFTDEGEVFMLPESCEARRLELWRAERVPDRWRLDTILLDDVAVADATLVRHGERYWIFAASAEPPGTSWDRLLLFHAPRLRGPWRAHRLNPVLIDAGAARPAGAMWHEAGALMRVAMDCRGGYGEGVTVLCVDRLDPDGYRQTPVRALPQPLGADGLHTFNRCAGVDFIDLRSWPSRHARRAGLTA